MDAIGQLLHMRGSVYEITHMGDRAYLLPLIERIGERSYKSRIDAIFIGVEATAWVEKHRSDLKAGTSLSNLHLLDIHIRKEALGAVVRTPPNLAPPRHAAQSSPKSITQAAAA